MDKNQLFYWGYVKKLHGVDGSFQVQLDVDDPNSYQKQKIKNIIVEFNGSLIPYFIERHKIAGSSAIIKVEDMNQEQAEHLIGSEIFLTLDHLPKLTGNKFYFHEVIGFEVVDTEKGPIGIIKEVIELPQHPVFQIINEAEKEILIPINDEFLKDVNRQEKKITVTAPEGLIDLYLE